MNTLELKSPLADTIQRMIDLRRITGSDYHAQAQLLLYFDRFLVDQGLTEPRLTRELIESYEKNLIRLAPRSRANRMCVVRQLCKYMACRDPETYVPDSLRAPVSQTTFRPYIYSVDEIQTLLSAAIKLPPQSSLRGSTYQTLLGILYSTGIRIGEAMALNLADFYYVDARLYISQGKFRKARWIPLSASANEALSRYVNQRRKKAPHSSDSPLFLNLRGNRLHHCTVNHCFHDLLRQCGIIRDEQSPRLHDLRHTFAVHRLLDWYRKEEDINNKLVGLSTYMGHVDIRSTHVYLQPTAELLEQVNDRFHRHYLQHVTAQGGRS